MLPRADVCCVLSRFTFVLWIYHQIRPSADRSRYANNWVFAFRVGSILHFQHVEDDLVCVSVCMCVCVRVCVGGGKFGAVARRHLGWRRQARSAAVAS